MTSQSINVLPGRVTPLRSALPGNPATDVVTFVNQDPTNSVWINSDASVAVNNGALLGPGAIAQWKGAAYACVDFAVLTPVSLLMSTDLDSLDNPATLANQIASNLSSNSGLNAAGIAAALAANNSLNAAGIAAALAANNALTAAGVAAALAAGGVPIIQSTVVLYQGALAQIDSTGQFDCAQYQTLFLRAYLSGGANGNVARFTVNFWDGTGSTVSEVLEFALHVAGPSPAFSLGVYIQLPVLGARVSVDVSYTGTTITAANLFMLASTKTNGATAPVVRNVGPQPNLLIDLNVSILANQTQSYFLGQCSGKLKIVFQGTTAVASGLISVRLLVWYPSTYSAITERFFNIQPAGTDSGDRSYEFDVPAGYPLRADLVSTATATATPNIRIFDIGQVLPT